MAIPVNSAIILRTSTEGDLNKPTIKVIIQTITMYSGLGGLSLGGFGRLGELSFIEVY